MRRVGTWVAASVLLVGLAGCGDNDITDEPAGVPSATAAVATATATAVSTATGVSSPTATAEPSHTIGTAPTATATSIPSATATDGIPPTPTATATITATPPATATLVPADPIALFNFDVGDPNNPFPSDRLLDDTGHVALPVAYLTDGVPEGRKFDAARSYGVRTAQQLRALDGFGTFTPIRIRFNRPMVVPPGLNPSAILLLEYDELAARPVPFSATAYQPDLSIEVQPILPLKPKTTYAVVVTTDIVDIDGKRVQPSPDFARLLAGSDLTPALAAWRERLEPVIDHVRRTFGVGTARLALVDLFTTQSITDDLVAIQQRLTTGELVPGAPCFDNCVIRGSAVETGIFPEGTQRYREIIGSFSSPNVAAVAVGVFESYDFRARANGPFDERYVYGPDIPGTNQLEFYLTIPKAARPPEGYPIAVFGHGLGGAGSDVGQVGRLDADLPVMGIGISALQHGRRGSLVNFFVLSTIDTTRENFRQTTADFMQLTRMVQNAQAAGMAPFDQVDPSRLLYLGGSLGGIIGTLYMAVEPDVHVGLLSVPGGGLLNIIDSIDIGALLKPLVSLQVALSTDDAFFPQFLHRFRQTAQWGIERADPINYAPYMIVPGTQLPGVPPKRILMHEGIVDSTVPNRTTDDLALAMRLPDLNASFGCTSPAGCSGIWRFVMTDYGKFILDGHGVTLSVPQATQQAFDYLTSFGTVVNDATP